MELREWLELYRYYHVSELVNDKVNREKKKNFAKLRLIIQDGTKKDVLNGFYGKDKIELQGLKESAKKTEMFDEFVCKREIKFEKTKIEVIPGDCLEVAIELSEKYGEMPVVLNMANAFKPGGGYRDGSGAQEENLFRRSNLFMCLDENPEKSVKYPIPEFGCIYTPNAVVFRGSEAKGYPYLSKPEYISFIASAAYRHPPLKEDRLDDKDEKGTKRKIVTILNVAYEKGHSIVVLSALGCGAFRNPPHHIAEIFKQVLAEFDGCFKLVVFAIFDDHNVGKHSNLGAFQEIFGK